jgi:hypothetical protein
VQSLAGTATVIVPSGVVEPIGVASMDKLTLPVGVPVPVHDVVEVNTIGLPEP